MNHGQPPETVAGAHSTTRSHADAIWSQRQIDGRPLPFDSTNRGVYIIPFARGEKNGLRNFFRASAEDINEKYRLGSVRKGEAAILFSVTDEDQLGKSPTDTGTGEEAIIQDDVELAVGQRTAFQFNRSRQQFKRNNGSERNWRRHEVAEILVGSES